MNIKDILIFALLAIVIIQLAGGSPLANEEIIEWTDYRGELVRVRVNRSLH